jgi:hypothetical protein
MFEYATVAVPVAPFVDERTQPETKTLVVAVLPLQIAPIERPAVSGREIEVVADEVVAPNAPRVAAADGVPDAVMYSVSPWYWSGAPMLRPFSSLVESEPIGCS